eukprot:9470456-Pyramimonas_sp.AAC.1
MASATVVMHGASTVSGSIDTCATSQYAFYNMLLCCRNRPRYTFAVRAHIGYYQGYLRVRQSMIC